MKKVIAPLVLTCLIAIPAANAGQPPTEVKQGAAFALSGVAGVVVAGPAGLLLGGLGGAWMGEQFKKADQLESTEEHLALANGQVESLLLDLNREQAELARLGAALENQMQASLARLEFEVMFRTGEDELQERDAQRMDMLAGYLRRNTGLKVRLDGYADPRGSDEYNNVLTRFRALSVAEALYQRGVEKDRVSLFYHGAQQSTAASGDYDAYARERRVNIEVYGENIGLAQSH